MSNNIQGHPAFIAYGASASKAPEKPQEKSASEEFESSESKDDGVVERLL